MAHDPLSHVASWLTPPTDVAASELTVAAEHERLLALAESLRDRAAKIAASLPEIIERKPWSDEVNRAVDEGRDPEEWRAKLRASRPRLEEALRAAGVLALEEEAEGLEERAEESREKLADMRALSWDGVLAQLAVLQRVADVDEVDAKFIDIIADGVKLLSVEQGPKPALVHDGDAEILSLFREWMAARRHASALYDGRELPDKEVEKQAWAHVNQLHCVIFDAPAAGVVGIAIKAYLQIHDWDDGWREDGAAVSRDSQHWRGLLKDAVRFVPELAPLAVNALKEPDEDDAEAEKNAEPDDGGAGEPEGRERAVQRAEEPSEPHIPFLRCAGAVRPILALEAEWNSRGTSRSRRMDITDALKEAAHPSDNAALVLSREEREMILHIRGVCPGWEAA